MSTEIDTIKTTEGAVTLTQFWGGEDRGLCLQLTQSPGTPGGFVQVTKAEALELANHIIHWVVGINMGARRI